MTLRVLGLDPGSRYTGFGVIDYLGYARYRYVSSGVIKTTSQTLAIRLKELFEGVTHVIKTFSPHQVCVEKVFVNVNPQSTLCLGQARGAVICAASVLGLDVQEFTALQVKKSVVGHGHADKSQVQYMVAHLLKLDKMPPPDAADALACAICYAHSTQA